MSNPAHFSIFPKAPDTARTSSSGGGGGTSSTGGSGTAGHHQKRPKSANPAHPNPVKRGLKYKNQNILPAGNDNFLHDNEKQFAAYAPSNNNHHHHHVNKEFNSNSNNDSNLMPREDILGNLHEAKKKVKSLENELSQQRAENQRLSMEIARQQKRLEKVLLGGGNNHVNNSNVNGGRSNHAVMEVFKEVEKSSLVRHLKQELSTIRDLLVEKENELEMIGKTNKGVYIMELRAENGECLNEIARQKAIMARQNDEIAYLKKKLSSSAGHPSHIGDVEKSELRKEISRLASGYESILSGYCNGGNAKIQSSLHYHNDNDNAMVSILTTDNASAEDTQAEERDSCTVREDEEEGSAAAVAAAAVNTSANSSNKLFVEKRATAGSKKKSSKRKSKASAAGGKGGDEAAELLNCFDYEEATRDEGILMTAAACKNEYDFDDALGDSDEQGADQGDDNPSPGGQREEMLRRLMEDVDEDRKDIFASTDNYEDDFDDFDD